MFSQNFQKSFTGNWNRKIEPGNDSFGRVSGYGTALDGCICRVLPMVPSPFEKLPDPSDSFAVIYSASFHY